MYLRRVDAYGFKSFADRQSFEFGPGLTAVVGPNGSGKSNIADAIRWALGEQSIRSMRGRKTEDLIFAGSDKRRQMSVAEVTLTLDNADGWMPVDFSEVTVTRRAYRSGENEYLINGQKVRLLDVHDLFRKAKVGQNSYAMMSQGLVDEVLALRPAERRGLIEEAADVQQHRVELTRSERRLAETRDNLGHVRVLIRELAPRLRHLERQTEKAKRYQVLHGELIDALEVFYEHQLRGARESLAAAQAHHDQVSSAYAEARAGEGEYAPRLESAQRLVSERRAALEAARLKERELAERQLRTGQALALAEQRLELLSERGREVEAQLAETAQVPPSAQADEDRVELDARVAGGEAALTRARESLSSADDAVRVVLRELAEAEARRTRLERELQDTERALRELSERVRREAEQRGAAGERRSGLIDRLRAYGRQALTLRREQIALEEHAGATRRRREVAERRLEDERRELAEQRDSLRAISVVVEQLDDRRRMIGALSRTVADGAPAAQALISAARGIPDDVDPDRSEPDPEFSGVVGLVSRLLHVPKGLEEAIEAALAEQLTALVVEQPDDAVAAIEYLRAHQAGVVTIYPLSGTDHVYPLNLFNERGVVGIAARLVRVEQPYRALIDTLLGRTIVVEDLDVARRMIRRGLGSVVTRGGVLLRPGGSYFGGSVGTTSEQFEFRRELDDLPGRIEAAQREQERAAARVQRLEPVISDARDAVDAARRALDQADTRVRAQAEARSLLRRALVAISGELRVADAQIGAAGRPDLERVQTELREQRAATRSELDVLAGEIAQLRDRSEAVGAERDEVAERVTAAAAQLAGLRGERDSAVARRAEREEERRLARERLAERRALSENVRREIEDIEHSLLELRTRIANEQTERTEADAAVGPAHASLAEVQEAERELSAARADAQARLFAAERDMVEAQAKLREAATRAQSLKEQAADDGLTVADDGSVRAVERDESIVAPGLATEAESGASSSAAGSHEDGSHGEGSHEEGAAVPARGGSDIDPEALRGRIAELRGQIRALGPVNIEALEDLSEESERHDFLSGQVNDLEAAEVQLREAMSELRRLIRTRFDETFAEVDRHFGEYFARFFGGGSARLEIVQGEEDEEPGVEIRAQPPGKRISSLNMLSGGERALTSVALLFALLAVNPAPICVLDEVDAALDEANVGRFVDTLEELYDRSQFIVITHNRRTVEKADTIYGVSMGEDSTSEVLSLRLADVPAMS